MSEAFRFTVNGEAVEVESERETPLLYVLRNRLGLKAARFGCGEGLCGACTVIVDGQAIFSCDTPVWSVQDKAVETVEGLAPDGASHPLQSAIVEEQAGQCGFCLTGIVMRAEALLRKTPKPNRAQIAEALERNLCRCGAHNRIIRAIERAAMDLEGRQGR